MMKGNTRYIIQNVTVIGVSDNVKTILAESRNTDWRTSHCGFSKYIDGVGFRVNGGIDGGAKFINMTFKGFAGNDECEESSAIVAEKTNVRHGLMDCEHQYEDILFDSATNRVSFCRVVSRVNVVSFNMRLFSSNNINFIPQYHTDGTGPCREWW